MCTAPPRMSTPLTVAMAVTTTRAGFFGSEKRTLLAACISPVLNELESLARGCTCAAATGPPVASAMARRKLSTAAALVDPTVWPDPASTASAEA